MNRFKVLDLIDRLPKELWIEVPNIVQELVIKAIPRKNEKRQNDMTLKDEIPRSIGVQYSTQEEQRNSPIINEVIASKRKKHPAIYVSDGESKVQCFKEHCIGTWNVRSMNQGKLDMVKQEMIRINTDILGISEPKMD